ncbi:MAG: [LysW]-lysine hydrolase [Planctomycetes bacterium]|nr:[LysW]-lysine hydrolase [Planctomycetota bacterium]
MTVLSTEVRRTQCDAAEALLHALVATPSLSGREDAAARELVGWMRGLGYQARVDEVGNAVGELGPPAGPGVREIVLLGHIDTVPGEIPVRREGDLLCGRGAVDAKGPLAAFTMAGATARLAADTRVVVIGAVGEEAPESRGARHVAGRMRPDLCIIGEPSGADGFVIGYKGRLLVDASAVADSAHSAGPAATSAELLAAWWQRVLEWAARTNAGRERVFEQVQPRLISFNTKADGLTESAHAVVSVRLPTDVPPRVAEAAMQEACGDRVGMECRGAELAFVGDRQSELARRFSVAIRGRFGRAARIAVKTGTSDMNVVGPVWNCPIVAYGPGDSALDHTPNEHISIAEYHSAIEVLRGVLEG